MKKYIHIGDVGFKEALINELRALNQNIIKMTETMEYQQVEQTRAIEIGFDQIQHWLKP